MRTGRRPRLLVTSVLVMDLLAASLAGGAVGLGSAGVAAAERSHVKVAVIVGPVGNLTDDYRRLADEAAAAARTKSDRVVTVYSPRATWPAVRAALTGASIVVYLGHGNGWPSPYRDSLYGRTQNGLGLNPVAGVDDEAHQYFGEAYVSQVPLAPGAVVVLGHLCYASGNPEPGAAEPTVEVARARADNYAAGWMAAGAAAVIAEGHGRPAYYVTALFGGRGTIEAMWKAAPTFRDHLIRSSSSRSTGATVTLDPDRAATGFFRSLTVLPGTRVADTLRGAATMPWSDPGVDHGPPARTGPLALARRGVEFGTPRMTDDPIAGSEVDVVVPLVGTTAALIPAGVEIGTRWDHLSPDGRSGSVTGDLGTGAVLTVPETTSRQDAAADEPPSVDLIGAETPGVVTTHPTTRVDGGLAFKATLPGRPGLYRLEVTIHDAHGVAYDAETQDLLDALVVRVTGSVWATYGLRSQATVVAGASFAMRVRLANTGTAAWSTPWSPRSPLLVGRWVSLDDVSTYSADRWQTTVDRVVIEPGTAVVVDVALQAPTRAGAYLLLFDVQDGDGASLASLGVPPGMVTVTVDAAGRDDAATSGP